MQIVIFVPDYNTEQPSIAFASYDGTLKIMDVLNNNPDGVELPPSSTTKKRLLTFWERHRVLIQIIILLVSLLILFVSARYFGLPNNKQEQISSEIPFERVMTFPSPTSILTNKNKISVSPTIIPSVNPSPLLHPTHIPAAGVNSKWKNYKNDIIGFSFMYPPEWGSIIQNDELCFVDGDLSSEYQNKPCKNIELATTVSSSFFSSQSIEFLNHRPGRGVYWGDRANDSFPHPKQYLDTYCNINHEYLLSCKEVTNTNNVYYIKSEEIIRIVGQDLNREERAFHYRILTSNVYFPIIIISNQSSRNDQPNLFSEKILDSVISSFRLTQ